MSTTLLLLALFSAAPPAPPAPDVLPEDKAESAPPLSTEHVQLVSIPRYVFGSQTQPVVVDLERPVLGTVSLTVEGEQPYRPGPDVGLPQVTFEDAERAPISYMQPVQVSTP